MVKTYVLCRLISSAKCFPLAGRQGLFSLLKSLQDKGVIRSFIYDTQTGQIQFGDIATLQTGTTPLLSSEILSQVPPQLEQIVPVISGTGVVTGSRITNEEAIKRRKDFLKKQEELMNQASDPLGITRISDKKKDKQIVTVLSWIAGTAGPILVLLITGFFILRRVLSFDADF